jgi:hypothetical protein
VLVALAAAGRSPADLTLPTAGSEAVDPPPEGSHLTAATAQGATIHGMTKDKNRVEMVRVVEPTPEENARGLQIIAGTTMLTTAPYSGPILGAWLAFKAGDEIQAGLRGDETLVYKGARGLGLSSGAATTVDIASTMPDAIVGAGKGVFKASVLLGKGAYLLEGAETGKIVLKEAAAGAGKKLAENPGQAAAGAAKATVETVDPFKIRYSQRTAGARGDAASLRQAIGTQGIEAVPPIDVVKTPSGLVTLDNTRPAVAREFGIREVPARVHEMNEPLGPSDLG